jgi:hypothetical protein
VGEEEWWQVNRNGMELGHREGHGRLSGIEMSWDELCLAVRWQEDTLRAVLPAASNIGSLVS